jgi:protease-4
MSARTILSCLVVVGLSAAAAEAEEKSAAIAHIRLAGSLDETPLPEDPLFGAGENLQSKLDRIRKARNDASIQGLLLHLDGLEVGWGKLHELRQAVRDVRAAGKKVFAYVDSGAISDYLVALACDEVCLPESAWLMLIGLNGSMSFYRDLFDKIGVQADMLQMGDFKGAAEPYTRSSMSKELRQQLESLLADLYDRGLVELIVQSRSGKQWTAEQVKKLIDQGPYTARAALSAGLIDRVAYAHEYQAAIQKMMGTEPVRLVRNYGRPKEEKIDLSNPFNLLRLLSPPEKAASKKPKIALLYATGVIVHGKGGPDLFGQNLTGSLGMIEAIRQAEEDATVKAIVLRVDSPGGSALASDLIWNELNRCQKPVVASMSDTAASGGYYLSMAARKIYAEPGTLTGSIGVVGGKIVIGGLEKKIGLNTEVISRGAHAGLYSSNAPFSESERRAVTSLMKDTYEQFLDKALAGRKKAGKGMTRAQLEALAGGRIWTGRQAHANGLVDELGTLADAIAEARKMAGVDPSAELDLLVLPKPRSFLDSLLDSHSDTRSPLADSARLALLKEVPGLAEQLRAAAPLLHLRHEPVWAVMPGQLRVR